MRLRRNFNLFWNDRSPRRKVILASATFLAFLALWELLPALGWANPFFTSSPSRILRALTWLFAHGFWRDIAISLGEFSLGMLLATVLGIGTGMALGWYRTLDAMFEPFVTMLNAMPRVALLPLIILWLGIGIESKVAAVFLGAFFPVVITVMKGVRTVDENLLKCARSFGGTDWQIFTTLVLPTCVPFIVAGLHIAVGRGLVGVVIGELLASQAGVGHMISVASSTFQTDKVFVGVLLLAGFGYLLTGILKYFENVFDSWRMTSK
jgi:ABC-type nitrate/sulfonate/bicarbonate transport system permease component